MNPPQSSVSYIIFRKTKPITYTPSGYSYLLYARSEFGLQRRTVNLGLAFGDLAQSFGQLVNQWVNMHELCPNRPNRGVAMKLGFSFIFIVFIFSLVPVQKVEQPARCRSLAISLSERSTVQQNIHI